MQEIQEGQWGLRLTRLLLGGWDESEIASAQRELDGSRDIVLKWCALNVITIRALTKLKTYGMQLPSSLEEQLRSEQERVHGGMEVIREVSQWCEDKGIPFVVMKTLDQYPDQGHDIDIFIDEGLPELDTIFQKQMGGEVLKRSLCDRLAQKVNYKLPNGFVLELHCTRLGQVGEHRRLGVEILRQRRAVSVAGVQTFAPPPEGQLLFAVLQRIYRHFNFRICDVVNMTRIATEGGLRLSVLEKLSQPAGIYPGTMMSLVWLQRLVASMGFTELANKFPELPRVPAHDLDLTFTHNFFRFSLGQVVPTVYAREVLTYLRQLSMASVGRLVALVPIIAIVGLNTRVFPTVRMGRFW